MHRLIFAVFVLLVIVGHHTQALVNGEAPAEDDTRFDAVCAFSNTNWLYDNDRDNKSHNWYGNGVLIAPDVVLIARHLLPADPKRHRQGLFAVRFRRHADGSLGQKANGPDSYHQVTVAKWIVAERADLALGILSKPVEHIQPVRVLLDRQEPVANHRAMLAGWGSESLWKSVPGPRRGLRVGENTVSARGSMLRVDSYLTEVRENSQGQRKTYIVDEHAVPNMHDSGGSIFLLDEEGRPTLAGIISTYSGGTYLPPAVKAGFPLEAATQGGRSLVKAADAARTEPTSP
ncbi:MAG: trypsin-like serine protease [Phycisphaeraceae bacterium]